MNELAELEELELEEKLLAPSVPNANINVTPPAAGVSFPTVPNTVFTTLPEVPTSTVTNNAESEEEAALRELQASMLA